MWHLDLFLCLIQASDKPQINIPIRGSSEISIPLLLHKLPFVQWVSSNLLLLFSLCRSKKRKRAERIPKRRIRSGTYHCCWIHSLLQSPQSPFLISPHSVSLLLVLFCHLPIPVAVLFAPVGLATLLHKWQPMEHCVARQQPFYDSKSAPPL